MSIVTKTGDDGTTGLMYNRRVSKAHARVEAYGTADELNAAIGMARAAATDDFLRGNLISIQKDLVVLMGELATLAEDRERYLKDGFTVVIPAMTGKLETVVKEIESQSISFKGWATPGANASAAALDMARTICRRTERRVRELAEFGESVNPEIVVYLNRLSDLLWLMARWAERAPKAG